MVSLHLGLPFLRPADCLQVVSGANAGAKTDAAGDEQARCGTAGRRVVFRLGTG